MWEVPCAATRGSTARQLTWVHILPAGVTTNIRLFLDVVEYECPYKWLGTGDSSYSVHLDQTLCTLLLDCSFGLSYTQF